MKLRSALIDDLKNIYTLICKLEESNIDIQEFSQIYLDNLADQNVHYIVAEDKGKLIGFISLHIQKLLHHVGKISEIQELFVVESYRRLGIGNKLLNEAKQVSLKNGCIQIEVCCDRKRAISHLFYLSQSMKKTHYKFTCDLKLNQLIK